MPIKSRVTQDRRSISRVMPHLECRLESQNTTCDATVVDLSKSGALISSPQMPAADEDVIITIKTKHLNKELKLTAKVLRNNEVMTEYGKRSRFAVRFYASPLDLTVLIGKLYTE